MESLGVTGSIGGVCDLKYIKLPSIQDGCSKGTIIDCGDEMNPDMEKIIELHPDAILLFRVGDFYETFGEDAIKASGILGITLTRRANGSATYVELAGFPYHAIDTYLPKLVRAGERVAICEQLEDPKLVKGSMWPRERTAM